MQSDIRPTEVASHDVAQADQVETQDEDQPQSEENPAEPTETENSPPESSQNHQEEIPDEPHHSQGHDDLLFCHDHILRCWNQESMDKHNQHMHPPTGDPSHDSLELLETVRALNCITRHSFNLTGYDFKSYQGLMDCVKLSIYNILKENIAKRKGVKVSVKAQIEFQRAEHSDHLDNLVTGWFSNLEGERGSQGVMKILLNDSEIMPFLDETVSSVEERVAKFTKTTSGLIVNRVMNLDVVLIDFKPISGGSFVNTPWLLREFKDSHVINVKNSEEAADEFDTRACFFYSLLAAKRVVKRVARGGQYNNICRKDLQESMKTYRPSLASIKGLKDFKLPMTLDQIPKFERLNPSYRVTVLGFENVYDESKYDTLKTERRDTKVLKRAHKMIRRCIYPLYISKNTNREAVSITLLLVETDNSYGHYIAVKDIDKLLAVSDSRKQYHCCFCLQSFLSDSKRNEHTRFCATIGLQVPIFPNGRKAKLKFREYRKMIPAPYKCFADFESILENIPVPHTATTLGKVANHHEYVFREKQTGGKTKYLQRHKIVGYSYVVLNSLNEIQCHKTYLAADDNEDVAETFLNDIKELATRLRSVLRPKQKESYKIMRNAPDNLDDETVAQQGTCYFCNEPLFLPSELPYPQNVSEPEMVKAVKHWHDFRTVRHHSHETHEYVALAHNECNFRAVVNMNIPVFFHNLGGYDGHAIIKSLAKMEGTVSIVPSTGEKYTALDWSNIKKGKVESYNMRTKQVESWTEELDGSFQISFLDSLRFLASSLQAQAKILAKSGSDAFPTTKKVFESLYPSAQADIELLYMKQTYPYGFVKCVKDFEFDHIPPQEFFFDELRNEDLPDESYAFAKRVWEAFGIKNMGEWTSLYCLVDVCILADAFCKFQTIFMKEFGIDPANYYSLPSTAWSAALKYSKVELSLITNNEMYQFLEGAVRGGLSTGGDRRYIEANNPYCPNYKPEEERNFLVNLDANSLYSWALSKKLPVNNFKWVKKEDLKKIDENFIMKLGEDDPTGYFFEVDITFPEETHDKFNAYPPAPQRRVVNESELSPYQKRIRKKLGMKNSSLKTPKLIADLTDRNFYVIHYMELKKYLELGVKLVKVHRALTFHQENWLAKFIELCSTKRAETTDPYENYFWKLVQNSVYGKTVEQKRGRCRLNIIKTEKSALALAKKATISDILIITENVVIIKMKAIRVTLNSPIYAGVTVLSRSKELMYSFYYDCLQKQYGHENLSLITTDTDSTLILVRCHDVYEDMRKPEMSFWLDRSDYSKDDPLLGPDMYDDTNRKVGGKFKDVTATTGVITSVCFLKPKLYSYKTTQNKTDVKAKGMDINARKDVIFDHFTRVLKKNDKTFTTTKRFQSVQHEIYTVEITKTGLTCYDDKRYHETYNESLAYGHYKIQK